MEELEAISGISKALSDPTRLKIVKLLAETNHPICVNAITQQLSVSQSAVSQHLRVLRQAGLAEGNRYGFHVHYVLNTDALKSYRKAITDLMGKQTTDTVPA
jgi:DNA-binding transcriptional ArsR family regulator